MQGHTGRDIVKYSKEKEGYVTINGSSVPINAQVHKLSGYSAHADQKGLVNWVETMPGKPGKIKLVHGDGNSQSTLKDVLRKKGYIVIN